MFRTVYFKLRKVYNATSKQYAVNIDQHPIVTIVSYLLLIITFSFGLFQLEFIRDNESLTNVRHSRVQADIKVIEEHFREDPYSNYYQHHLLDLGYYAEVIIKLKCLKRVEKTAEQIGLR